eukprot:10612364-Ditylum_brightwellii.AAC.1
MCQAKVVDILEKNYVTPDSTNEGYELHKTKDAFLKNHLLTATMGLNASFFINVKTMTGVKMYNTLLDIFQGLEHDEDTAVNATAVWEQLKFNHYIKNLAETFLAKMNDCSKKMEVDDGAGRTFKPFSDAIFPSLLHVKVDHASFNTWKALSEKDREDRPTIQ